MAKYDWEKIENAYQLGVDVDTICLKYKVAKKTLQNRIYDKKLTIKSGNINEASAEFGQALGKFSAIAQNDDNLKDIVESRIKTIAEDNGLMGNNRKIAKMLQSVIVANRNSINLQNIKNVSGTLKDIESIANPQASKQEINIQNTNAMQNITKIERKIIE